MPFIELAYGLYCTACIILCLKANTMLRCPCPPGDLRHRYYYVGFMSLYSAYLPGTGLLTKPWQLRA